MKQTFPKMCKLLCVFALTGLVLSGCKAQSSMMVSVRDNASGNVVFILELDEQAASVIRRDSYNTSTLSKIFDSKELQSAGFKVEIDDNTNGDPSRIEISADFNNEKELKAILSVFAPPESLSAEIDSKSTIVKSQRTSKVTVDVSSLRKMYLNDEGVKLAVEEAGIEYTEFEDLVDEAMKSTVLEVELKQDGKFKAAKVTGETKDKKLLQIKSEHVRTNYLLTMGGAIFLGLFGLILLWRICRTPRLLSKKKK